MKKEEEPWRLFYDGTCNLCYASTQKVIQWAASTGQPLEVLTLQEQEAQEKGYGKHLILEADGRVYVAGDAWLRIMAMAPWYLRWISWTRFTPITAWIAKFFYNIVANTRHFWLGRRRPGAPCVEGVG